MLIGFGYLKRTFDVLSCKTPVPKHKLDLRFNVGYFPNCSLAILAPLTRFAIFLNAISLAKSGLPCLGLTSMENGENPQSSVAPS